MTITAEALAGPLRSQQPLREPADFRGTVRMTDWSAGYNVSRLQDFPYAVTSAPAFFDAQNIDFYSVPGTCRLCPKSTAIEAAEALNHEYLYYGFGNNMYRIPLANFSAALFQKITTALGAPAWAALTNIYPGAVAPRGATVWRDSLYVASGDTVVRIMSAGEVWTTIAAPAGVTAPISGQVGIYQDDRLLCWWEGTAQAGLYAWDGVGWAKVYPTAGTNPTVSALTCDAIVRGAGSTLIFMRDASGTTTMVEAAQLSTGTQFQPWIDEPGLRVWPQCADVYQGDVYLVGQLGADNNRGFFMQKPTLSPPVILDVLDTNYATAGQKGLDWSWRSCRSTGDTLWIGGSSRDDHDAALYRFFLDPDSGLPSFGPTVVIDGIPGPIYSIGILPASGTGASTTNRLHMSVTKNGYYRDRENDADPTLDAPTGYIQFPDVDLGIEDHVKVWAILDANLVQKSAGGSVEIQYRIDPRKLDVASSPWQSLGFCAAVDNNHFETPDDNPQQDLYGSRCRTLQLRAVFSRATSGADRDVLDMISTRLAQIVDLIARAI